MKTLLTAMQLAIFICAILLALPAFAQQTFNPHTGQWEYNPQPNVPTGGGGAVDDRTGTYFAPSGGGGTVNTRDGTVWTRSGDTLINTRTGQAVPSPRGFSQE